MPFDVTVAAMWATAMIAGRHYAEIDDRIDLEQWDAVRDHCDNLIFEGYHA